MNSAVILGFVRHILQIAAGALASRGVIGENEVETVAGAALALGTVAWFAIERKRRNK